MTPPRLLRGAALRAELESLEPNAVLAPTGGSEGHLDIIWLCVLLYSWEIPMQDLAPGMPLVYRR